MIKEALPADIPWLGAMPYNDHLSLPERHLGLHLAQEINDIDQRIEAAAQLLGRDIPLPPTVRFYAPEPDSSEPLLQGKTIAVAKDAAFCFIYQANLDLLQTLGARIMFFSPLQDAQLPVADAYWLPGGYPELHLEKIENNTGMRDSFQAVAAAGKPILAECGGMLSLGESLDGRKAFGLLSGHGKIESKRQGLGTQHATLPIENDTATIGAHTFHYGRFETALPAIAHGKGKYGAGEAIYHHQNITASFLHFYFPSNPALAAQFFLP
jgi:cobyrinic acid a,c-diamide synthase